MSLWADMQGRHAYLDSNVFIAHREAGGAVAIALHSLFALLEQGVILPWGIDMQLARSWIEHA